MGAATAMAYCSGSFTLSFWSLNIRVNVPSKDMIPDQKIAFIILQIRKRES